MLCNSHYLFLKKVPQGALSRVSRLLLSSPRLLLSLDRSRHARLLPHGIGGDESFIMKTYFYQGRKTKLRTCDDDLLDPTRTGAPLPQTPVTCEEKEGSKG